jgi:nitrate reductase gamma subunit
VLALVARPLTGLRLALVATMGVGFLAFLYIPWLSTFFLLQIDDDAKTLIAVILGAIGALLLLLANQLAARRLITHGIPAGAGDADGAEVQTAVGGAS